MSFSKVAGYAGLAFVGLLVAVNIALGASGRPFEATAPVEDVVTWFAESRGVVDFVTVVAPIIWIGMTVFGVGIVVATRRADGSVDPWALVGLVGVAMQHAIFSGVIGTDAVLAARDGVDSVTGLVWQLHHAPFSLNNASIAMALGGFALAAIGSGLAPRWLRWAAGIGVIGLLANAMQTSFLLRGDGLFVLGLVGFAGWAVFALVVAVRLLRRPAVPAVG